MQWVTSSVMPYAATTRMPSISESTGMIRPNTPTRTVWPSGMPCSNAALMTNGMSEMWVTECLAIVGHMPLAENFGCSTTVPPAPSTDQIAQLCEFTWKNGRNARYVSSAVKSMLVGFTLAAHRTLPWLCRTAFGFDV